MSRVPARDLQILKPNIVKKDGETSSTREISSIRDDDIWCMHNSPTIDTDIMLPYSSMIPDRRRAALNNEDDLIFAVIGGDGKL